MLSCRILDITSGSRRRSRFVPGLDVRGRVRLALSLAAALPDNRFEYPVLSSAAEHGPQLRSQIESILDVPQRVRLRFLLPCGLAWMTMLSCRLSLIKAGVRDPSLN